MINRCIYCGSVCPDFSDMCDGCAAIKAECDELCQELDDEFFEDKFREMDDEGF